MAAHRGDDGVLKLFIDAPAVRLSLDQRIAAAASGQGQNAAQTVDNYLSARGLDLLLNGAGPSGGRSDWTNMGYRGLNRFVATRSPSDRPQSGTAFTFERKMPFQWKLERIDLPGGRN